MGAFYRNQMSAFLNLPSQADDIWQHTCSGVTNEAISETLSYDVDKKKGLKRQGGKYMQHTNYSPSRTVGLHSESK